MVMVDPRSKHATKADRVPLRIVGERKVGQMNWYNRSRTKVEDPSAEAKKAEGARKEALLIPRPLHLTGRVA